LVAEKLVILGGGPAGLSAAIYASREGFDPLVIAGYNPGGQLTTTTMVENYPGFPDGIDGPELVERMRRQAEKFGARFVQEDVTEVDFGSRPYRIVAGGVQYEAACIIIATGANPKMLGLESEKKFVGRGVSTCGTCDGPFYKGKKVVLVGGGDTAMEDALFLTRFATQVTVIHRRDAFRASKIMQERVLSNPKIKVVWNTVVEEIKGEAKVNAIRTRNMSSGETADIATDGVFIAIGYAPNSVPFKGKIKLDDNGYIIPSNEVFTDIDGVFVAGDVADHVFRQAATAVGSGVKAALAAREYLSNQGYQASK
jgi:thioredoxin reductase (NADPH)